VKKRFRKHKKASFFSYHCILRYSRWSGS